MLPAVTATRYVTPLREGGSLPGLMEADDLGTYVVKWRAAGQGVRVLVAEVVCGELARALALPVPALVTVDVAAELAVGEPDPEVQELLQRSAGTNLGLDYLPGALDFEAGVAEVDCALAGRVLWFDALIGNVDRSWRNPNMLFWHGRLQLIDHGAALTFHHSWPGAPAAVARPYDAAQHALVECRPDVRAADADLGPRVTRPLLERVLAQVPDDWLEGPEPDEPPAAVRQRYVDQLLARLAARDAWLPGLVTAAAAGGAGRQRPRVGQNRPAWLGPPPPEGMTQR
ncbi:HipA family kinase [Blastococcus sp. SYSU D00813]